MMPIASDSGTPSAANSPDHSTRQPPVPAGSLTCTFEWYRDTGSGPANDLLSANLYARNGVGGSAYMYSSSTGEVFCFADGVSGSSGYQFATPVTLGQYSTLAITLDYATHLAAFEVNGVTVGILPFGGSASEFFRGATLEFAALDAPAVIDPSLYTGHWDNLVILAMPSVAR